jgi:hypothetical protein
LVIALRTDLVAASSGQESWEGGRDAGVGAEYRITAGFNGKTSSTEGLTLQRANFGESAGTASVNVSKSNQGAT